MWLSPTNFLVICLFIHHSHAYSMGAPDSACNRMTPGTFEFPAKYFLVKISKIKKNILAWQLLSYCAFVLIRALNKLYLLFLEDWNSLKSYEKIIMISIFWYLENHFSLSPCFHVHFYVTCFKLSQFFMRWWYFFTYV